MRRRGGADGDVDGEGALGPSASTMEGQTHRARGPPTMKLASYKDGSRGGAIVVVSRDLCTAHYATGIAKRMKQVLDDWNFLLPQLEDLCQMLNPSKAPHPFA